MPKKAADFGDPIHEKDDALHRYSRAAQLEGLKAHQQIDAEA